MEGYQHINRCEAGDRRVDAIELLDFAAIYGCAVSDLLPDGASAGQELGE